MTEMVEVRVFYDGTVEVEPTDSCHATQHLYITYGNKSGQSYYCKKDKVDYYKKRLVKEMIKRQKEKVKEEQNKLQKLLDVKWCV